MRSLLVGGVASILVIDARSSEASTRAVLHELGRDPRVRVVVCGTAFHKARMLNEGLRAATSEHVLTSDADIVWNAAAIDALSALASRRGLAYVARVTEQCGVQPRSRARLRCDFSNPNTLRIALDRNVRMRPGYGLLLARRDTLFHIGGYSEDLVGWGWEDLDILARAHAHGVSLRAAGSVVHLTHGDDVRDVPAGLTRIASRNANLLRALARYREGSWTGSLAPARRTTRSVAVVVTRGARRELCAS